jgi:hypothetical protein
MKFLLKNSENNEVIHLETDSVKKAKYRTSQAFRDLDPHSLIFIYRGKKLLYSKMLCDRFWTDGMRTSRKVNSEMFTPSKPLLKRLENLKAKKKELETYLEKVNRFIAETEKCIYRLKKEDF